MKIMKVFFFFSRNTFATATIFAFFHIPLLLFCIYMTPDWFPIFFYVLVIDFFIAKMMFDLISKYQKFYDIISKTTFNKCAISPFYVLSTEQVSPMLLLSSSSKADKIGVTIHSNRNIFTEIKLNICPQNMILDYYLIITPDQMNLIKTHILTSYTKNPLNKYFFRKLLYFILINKTKNKLLIPLFYNKLK